MVRRGEEGEDKVESRLENHNHEELGDKSEDGSHEVTGGGELASHADPQLASHVDPQLASQADRSSQASQEAAQSSESVEERGEEIEDKLEGEGGET